MTSKMDTRQRNSFDESATRVALLLRPPVSSLWPFFEEGHKGSLSGKLEFPQQKKHFPHLGKNPKLCNSFVTKKRKGIVFFQLKILGMNESGKWARQRSTISKYISSMNFVRNLIPMRKVRIQLIFQ